MWEKESAELRESTVDRVRYVRSPRIPLTVESLLFRDSHHQGWESPKLLFVQVLLLCTFHLLLLLLVFLLVTCPSLNITLSLTHSSWNRKHNTTNGTSLYYYTMAWLLFVSNYSASFSSGLISYERHPLKNSIIRLCQECCSRRNRTGLAWTERIS